MKSKLIGFDFVFIHSFFLSETLSPNFERFLCEWYSWGRFGVEALICIYLSGLSELYWYWLFHTLHLRMLCTVLLTFESCLWFIWWLFDSLELYTLRDLLRQICGGLTFFWVFVLFCFPWGQAKSKFGGIWYNHYFVHFLLSFS